eukprot:scaffold287_cov337-Pavlova_lutheri.AAC.20
MGVEPHPVPSCTTRPSVPGDGSVLGSLFHAPTRARRSGLRNPRVGYVRPFQEGSDACTYLANFEAVVGPFRRVVAKGDGGTRTRTREAVQHGARIPSSPEITTPVPPPNKSKSIPGLDWTIPSIRTESSPPSDRI